MQNKLTRVHHQNLWSPTVLFWFMG